MTAPGEHFLEVLRQQWSSVMEFADADQRELLVRLVTGLELDDAVDARAALADEVMEFLPEDHPVIEALRGNVMFGETSVVDVELSLRRLRVNLGLTSAATGESRSEPRLVPVSLAPSATRPGELDDFDRTVRANLRSLQAFEAAQLNTEDVDRPDLIRLPGDDGDGPARWPAFQFDPQRRPHAAVLRINALLHADSDPWGVMCWWVYPHARLAAVPSELLGVDEPLLTRAAYALLED